jgi:hypothetical protein
MMTVISASSPAHAQAHVTGHAVGGRDAKPSRLWLLIEALAYAGAAIDPASALAAQRFARIRDQERRAGRW